MHDHRASEGLAAARQTPFTSLPAANNFDLLRFLFASIVVLVHGQELQTNVTLPFTRILSSTFAVQGFFVISGLLIMQSFDRSRSLMSYAGKRVRASIPRTCWW